MSKFIDVHALQTVPPSCINRDDTGSPKTARYGGVMRARVSSQAWKNAMRKTFRELYDDGMTGLRTKKIVGLVAEEIKRIDDKISDDSAEKMATDALANAGITVKSADKGTDAIFFMSRAQAKTLAELIISKEKDKKLYNNALLDKPAVDMLLFGRMVASDPSLNYDAASQVAHSISTHEVHNEFDYFTAVDDLAAEDNAGAAHLGTTEFNSSTLYRYATVNVSELKKYLSEEETATAARRFVEAFVCSMPTGKQNSFANRTYPDAVYITVRDDQPVNLVGAFEKPVRTEGGYALASAERLKEYAEKTYRRYSAAPACAFCFGDGLEGLAEELSFDEMLKRIEAAVSDEVRK